MSLTLRGEKLMLHFEGCDQPGECVGGDSGVTIGIGDDLGYTTIEGFKKRWQSRLKPTAFARLITAIGHKKVSPEFCAQFRDIRITMGDAVAVFKEFNIPEAEAAARLAFPNFDQLPEGVRDALTSLAYNRGTSMGDPDKPADYARRSEMRDIQAACANAALTMPERTALISAALHSMERLWPNNTKSDGDLNDRRHAEGYLADPTYICLNRKV